MGLGVVADREAGPDLGADHRRVGVDGAADEEERRRDVVSLEPLDEPASLRQPSYASAAQVRSQVYAMGANFGHGRFGPADGGSSSLCS
jgi:hypothetical protein